MEKSVAGTSTTTQKGGNSDSDENESVSYRTAESSENEEEKETSENMIDMLQSMFAKHLTLEKTKPEQVLDEVSFDGVVRYIKSGKCNNIIAMVGAGISTSAGIPDFRSPGTGLYNNLQKYDLPTPESLFDIHFFKENPEPFYDLAKELLPGKFEPTPCHYFLALLNRKNLLKRLYTQNIDTLERVAGISGDKLVEAHGTFHTSHCIKSSCKQEYSMDYMTEKIKADVIPKCEKCGSTIKPDIIFFGENLPHRFFDCVKKDFKCCNLLIIIGTSLTVQPFAGLIDEVPASTPRLLINKEKSGEASGFLARLMGLQGGMDFDSDSNYRDVCWLGLCDDGCKKLADDLGWKEELEQLIQEGKKKNDQKSEMPQKL